MRIRNARCDIDPDQWCRFSPMLPFSSREGVWRFGVGDHFVKPLLEQHRTVRDVRGGNCRFSRSRDGPRWFAAFAAVGDWDVRHRGSGAACHLVFLLREIEVGFI